MKQGMNVRRLGLTILTCFVLLFPASAGAVGYYVDIQNGTDDGSHGGSAGTGAWKTLHYAVGQVSSGDVLNVAAGTYNIANGESDSALTITEPFVTIEGAAGGTSIVRGSGSASSWSTGIIVDASDVTIRRLTVTNFVSSDLDGQGIQVVSGPGNIIEGCRVYNNLVCGIEVVNCSPTIKKNLIYDNNEGIYVYGDGAIAAPIISNNLIYETSDDAMDQGIRMETDYMGTVSPVIYHNTIDGPSHSGVWMEAFDGTASPDIKFNIITDFDSYGIWNSDSYAGTPIIAYNDVWTTGTGPSYFNCTAGPGSISQNPLYASYELQSTSPCIDAIPSGVSDPVGDDIDGNARPQGDGYDMGAYESAVSISEVIPIPPGTEVPDYIMVSFTVQPDNPSCPIVFGDDMGGAYDPEDFRIGGYDATLAGGSYRECDGGLVIQPGNAYWILARDGLKATVNGIPASLNDTEVPLLYSAATGNGWGQIGCPNAANYLWEDVEVVQYGAGGAIVNGPTCIFDLPSDNPMIDRRLWRWNGGSYLDNTTVVVQGEGYWVRARTSNVSLIFRQSLQLAQVSNTAIMFADLWSGTKRWAKQWVFGPQSAIADSGDTPPMPMEAITAPVSEEGGGGGCLINTTARG
ncbi:MAG: right-handed parallel beta-helix repeat-containing protein, partial [Deltaproteobacteria bacterium]|nr:right-handed parallel beta-helix repeat-containing protein [Deltaproteobacteria bacterium]